MNYQKNLLFLLKKHKMSKSELARRLGTGRQNITTLLITKDPRVSTVMKLCTIFNVTLDDLIIKDLTV